MSIKTLYALFKHSEGVTTDSRHCTPGTIFFALRGDTFDGNLFAAKALEQGCTYAVVDSAAVLPTTPDERYILVKDVLKTLQKLARHHRRQMKISVIAITGTNGKTTTKELLAAVLSTKYSVLYTEGNLNNHIGVPLTLLRLKREHQVAVIEMGASHPGDIKELVEIAEPDFGLITNVGLAHLQGFGSFEGVLHTKGELYDYLREHEGTAFVDADNPYLTKMAEGIFTVLYGAPGQVYLCGNLIDASPYLEFSWWLKKGFGVQFVKTQLIGAYNLQNALAAVCVGNYFGAFREDIDKALTAYTPQNNRSQLQKTDHNTLIIDAYNANPTSMNAALTNFLAMKAEAKMMILGDMLELGEASADEHKRVIDLLVEHEVKDVLLVGTRFAATKHPYTAYPDVEALITAFQTEMPQGKTILIKGSNGIRLGKLLPYL
jgi:UDP-N-acetylmuramoyl-tripeptide--D-alanyl-D-alanine ligase